jgi:hypothetical protein
MVPLQNVQRQLQHNINNVNIWKKIHNKRKIKQPLYSVWYLMCPRVCSCHGNHVT